MLVETTKSICAVSPCCSYAPAIPDLLTLRCYIKGCSFASTGTEMGRWRSSYTKGRSRTLPAVSQLRKMYLQDEVYRLVRVSGQHGFDYLAMSVAALVQAALTVDPCSCEAGHALRMLYPWYCQDDGNDSQAGQDCSPSEDAQDAGDGGWSEDSGECHGLRAEHMPMPLNHEPYGIAGLTGACLSSLCLQRMLRCIMHAQMNEYNQVCCRMLRTHYVVTLIFTNWPTYLTRGPLFLQL